MLFWKSASTGQKPTCCCRPATLLLSYLSFKAKGSMILSTKMRPKSQLATLYFEAKKWGKWPPETQSACWPHFSKLSTSNIRDPPMLIWHNHPVKSKGEVICFYAKSFLDLDTFFFLLGNLRYNRALNACFMNTFFRTYFSSKIKCY